MSTDILVFLFINQINWQILLWVLYAYLHNMYKYDNFFH